MASPYKRRKVFWATKPKHGVYSIEYKETLEKQQQVRTALRKDISYSPSTNSYLDSLQGRNTWNDIFDHGISLDAYHKSLTYNLKIMLFIHQDYSLISPFGRTRYNQPGFSHFNTTNLPAKP